VRRLFPWLAAASLLLSAATVHADDSSLSVASVTSHAENHLPAWVQTARTATALFSGDSGGSPSSSVAVAQLNQNTFLRVLDGGRSRLQVQVYDQDGDPAQTGWVDADRVLPSAPATNWLVSTAATTLWSADDSTAATMRHLDRFTPLQRLADPALDRMLVRVYRPDFTGTPELGWIDTADVGPAVPPQMRVPEGPSLPVDPPRRDRLPVDVNQQQAFLTATAQAARQAGAATHVPASVTLAQAILESDWGRSTLAQDANNYFGMKVAGTLGNDGLVFLPTSEYDDAGNLYTTTSAFRAYKSLADSVADHDELLGTASRYAQAMQASDDPRQFAALIAQEGYSSDPDYADKLVALMDRFDLYQFDASV
jgi:flagellar protein FlgJ